MNSGKIEINDQFARAFALMEEGKKNLFVTGRAGTGKSTLLSYFREKTGREVVVLAPTGVAAVNVAGQTIHSFFGFKPDITVEKARRAAKKAIALNDAKVYREMQTLIIDEVSMVRSDLFDSADAFLRIARQRGSQPFGGVNVVLIGDLYQLPPVVISSERAVFQHHYKSPWFFDSKVYPEMGVELVELEKIYRQHDEKFISLLNAVRNNTIDTAGVAALNSRFIKDEKSGDSEGFVHLTSLNREADAINQEKLAALPGKIREFVAEIAGNFDEKAFPARRIISLKAAAQVMLLNNDADGRWVNGTIGKIVKTGAKSVQVKLQNGIVEDVAPHSWQMFRFDLDAKTKKIVSEPVGNFKQLPLMLAWAVTIHKAQGKTFDRAAIDVGRAFAAGQVYVALSRLRSLDGMILKRPLKKEHVRVDWRVVKFMTSHHYAISEKALPLDQKVAMIEDAIKNRCSLEIVYLKGSDVKSKRVIKPLGVGEMEYEGWPFLGVRAFCESRHEERTFRVDRILKMRTL